MTPCNLPLHTISLPFNKTIHLQLQQNIQTPQRYLPRTTIELNPVPLISTSIEERLLREHVNVQTSIKSMKTTTQTLCHQSPWYLLNYSYLSTYNTACDVIGPKQVSLSTFNFTNLPLSPIKIC